jgi:hypothetical protein
MKLTFNLISGLRDKITQANLCSGSVDLVTPMSHTIKFVVSTTPESAPEPEASASNSNASASRHRSSLAIACKSITDSTTQVYRKIDGKVQAFEHEPVPEEHFKGWLSFLGLFTSRHTAGTEFAIGPLFVARGSTDIDIIVGLFIGNLLATLSWRFVVAPLAVSQRLTAYYAMERCVERRLIMVYDVLDTYVYKKCLQNTVD